MNNFLQNYFITEFEPIKGANETNVRVYLYTHTHYDGFYTETSRCVNDFLHRRNHYFTAFQTKTLF